MRKINIQPYSPQWPEHYHLAAHSIREVLGNELMMIEHIGSTAVPHLPARPMIDIIVGVEDIEALDEYNALMAAVGFYSTYNSDLPHRRFFTRRTNQQRTHQVFVFETGHTAIWRTIHMTRYLAAHPAIAAHYGSLKQQSSRRLFQSVKRYNSAKAAFFKRISLQAKEWAAHLRLETERLILRPMTLDDAPTLYAFANTRGVADKTCAIPYPLGPTVIERWIAAHRKRCLAGKQVICAVTLKATGEVMGSISLTIDQQTLEAETGYWLGEPHRGYGYCTEALRAMIQYGFQAFYLRRIFARCFSWNTPSAGVLLKNGMSFEKTYGEYVEKWDRTEPMDRYAIFNPNIGSN